MSVGAVGNNDMWTMYPPINQTTGVNPFGGGAIGKPGGGAPEAQPIGMQERHLDAQMLANKAENAKNGLGGTNFPVDPITGEPCKMFIA